MKYVDEYRDPVLAKRLVEQIQALVTREWTIMEVCGGQTHTIVRFGLAELLPRNVTLVHGPGCPVCVTPAFILEEGFPLDDLQRVVASMAEACREAGVWLVTGDTKVVEKGKGDGLFITTSGIGVLSHQLPISADQARPEDLILVSGTLGDHGIAVLSAREGLEFETTLVSDSCRRSILSRPGSQRSSGPEHDGRCARSSRKRSTPSSRTAMHAAHRSNGCSVKRRRGSGRKSVTSCMPLRISACICIWTQIIFVGVCSVGSVPSSRAPARLSQCKAGKLEPARHFALTRAA